MHQMHIPIGRLSVALGAALACGCTITIDGGDGNQPPSTTTIDVVVVNGTGKPLDAQMYVGLVSSGLDQLFVPANQRTDFGIGNIGILDAGDRGSFTIACGEPVFIGTQGGAFGDDLKNPTGHGEVFVLQENLNVRCGDIVTFAFVASGNTLQVGASIEPAP